MNPEVFGRIAFNAYNQSKGGLTYDGKKIPPWKDLPPDVQLAWTASAKAVMQAMEAIEPSLVE